MTIELVTGRARTVEEIVYINADFTRGEAGGDGVATVSFHVRVLLARDQDDLKGIDPDIPAYEIFPKMVSRIDGFTWEGIEVGENVTVAIAKEIPFWAILDVQRRFLLVNNMSEVEAGN